jgi:hypothetical protein
MEDYRRRGAAVKRRGTAGTLAGRARAAYVAACCKSLLRTPFRQESTGMAESVQSGRGAGPLATFAFMAGPRYGAEVPVPHPVVMIGRGPDADVRIDDDSISDTHARLEYDMGAWRLTDLESTNGTAIEGVRLAPEVPTPLPYGTTVRLGGVRLQFREVDAADPDAARAAYAPPARFPVWLAFVILVIAVAVGITLYAWFAAPAPRPADPPTPVPTATTDGERTP